MSAGTARTSSWTGAARSRQARHAIGRTKGGINAKLAPVGDAHDHAAVLSH